jgi:glycosyltransferase involved in cell wall biosynthesis
VGAISNYSAKLAKDFGAKHVIITPNAVDPKITAIGLLPHKSDKYFHILSTSKMIPRNGLDLLLAALVIIDDPKIRLHLTSNGPEETKLKQYIKDHDLDKQVIFHGLVKSKDLIGLYQQADIFVRPSRAEGLGTSFLEAMAYGVPIVATPVGGIPDFLTDHQTGLMAKTENPESVAGQIKTLMANPALREKLRTNGRRVIEEKYTWDRIGGTVDREFLKLYQQILCLLLLNSKRKVQKSKL